MNPVDGAAGLLLAALALLALAFAGKRRDNRKG
jgi:hypothetical protein